MLRRALPLLLCLTGSAHALTPLAMTPAQIAAAGIRLAPVASAAASEGEAYAARIQPAPEAEWVITAPLAGVVTRLLVAEGDAVRRGQGLLQLRAPAAPALAARLKQADGAARLAASERDRDRRLHAEGIIAARRLQASEQQSRAADSERDAAAAELRLMGLSPAEAAAGTVVLRAPADALVVNRPATLGQRVSEADPLLQLADPGQLGVELQVPVAQAAGFRTGGSLRLVEPSLTATIRQVGWGAAGQSQSVLVRARLNGRDATLRPGQWVRVRRADATTGMVTWQVPAGATLRQGAGQVLFIRTRDGFRVQPVTVLGEHNGLVQVSGPLRAGDTVAVSGLVTLKSLLAGTAP